MKISVLVPAYNEEATILDILSQVNAQRVPGVNFEVIVIDDGSKDRTVALLKTRPDLYTKLLCMQKNGGKGAAVRAGLSAATGDYILFQDADLEYNPEEYPKLLLPAQKFGADIVLGSRFMAPQYARVHYFCNKVGNKLITFIFNIFFNTTFTDIYTCYFMFRRHLVKPEELKTNGWQQQAEILCKAVKRSKAYYEVPISYHGRTYEEGKKIRPKHALSVIWTIFTHRFRA